MKRAIKALFLALGFGGLVISMTMLMIVWANWSFALRPTWLAMLLGPPGGMLVFFMLAVFVTFYRWEAK